MPLDILLTVIATAMIQSIFGVGVLLFGTPVLLLLGYDFVNALSVLLPISIAINALQIIKHYRFIDQSFYKGVLVFSIPMVVLFLIFASTTSINIGALVGGFLIFVAIKDYFPFIQSFMQKMLQYQTVYLLAMGLIHGLTNLGGSLLTAIVHGKNYEKDMTRVTVAICYATFAVFQLMTLFLIGTEFELSLAAHMSFLQIGVIVFLFTEEMVYTNIDNKKYAHIFAGFLLVSGILLIFK